MGWQKINESELHVLMWMNFKNIILRVICAITYISQHLYEFSRNTWNSHAQCVCACIIRLLKHTCEWWIENSGQVLSGDRWHCLGGTSAVFVRFCSFLKRKTTILDRSSEFYFINTIKNQWELFIGRGDNFFYLNFIEERIHGRCTSLWKVNL